MIRRGVRFAAALLLGLQLSGCATYSLEELRHTTPSGNPFQNRLATLYMDFAQEAERNYDWKIAMRFGDKGLQSAYGKDTAPEELSDWPVSNSQQPTLEAARADLVMLLTPEAEEKQPQAAAQAQFYFDCWVARQSKNATSDTIADCRAHFSAALTTLRTAADAAVTPRIAPAHASAPQKVPPPEHIHTQQKDDYLVFFEWNSPELTRAGKVMVGEVIYALKKLENYDVVLGGHTDRSGSAKYNLKLAQTRAQLVKDQLVAGGIAADKVKIFSYGESDPLVATADGVKNARNRRVEISLNQ